MPVTSLEVSRSHAWALAAALADKACICLQQLQVRCAAVAVQLSRVLLTPTRVKLQPAEPEMSNRVVRHFCSHGFLPRDFLRASCGEEDGRKLYSPTASAELSAVYQHVQAILNDGEMTHHRRAVVSVLLTELSARAWEAHRSCVHRWHAVS